MDQLELSGHAQRESDLGLPRDIGFKAVRYPVLWERMAPNDLQNIDWTWSDQRLHKLRDLGIRPIVGLLHHGSGPKYTNLLDPGFPKLFAEYARAVAERYPWVDAYTPINEPLIWILVSACQRRSRILACSAQRMHRNHSGNGRDPKSKPARAVDPD
jgi:dTDP-4-dehydrorhamnose reductase